MPYVPKTDWKYNDVLSENDMNRVEEGIAEGKQLIESHADDKNNPHSVTTEQIGAETPEGAQAKVDEHVNDLAGAHSATAITIDDAENRFTSSNVEGALNELFTSADNGKAQVKAAIVAKGGSVTGTAPHSFQELADGVNSIEVGDYRIGDTIPVTSLGKNILVDRQLEGILGYDIRLINENSIRTKSGGSVYAFDGNGVQKWVSTVGYTLADIAVSKSDEAVYGVVSSTTGSSSYTYHYSSTGVRTTLTEAGSGGYASNVVVVEFFNSHLYIGSSSKTIYKRAISMDAPATISTVWGFTDTDLTGGTIYSLAVDSKGAVYYGYNSVEARNLRKRDSNGVLLWSYSTSLASPRVTFDRLNNILYVRASNTILRIDPDTGTRMWQVTVPNSDPIVGVDQDGNVYVSLNGSGLMKIRPDGTIAWTESSIKTRYSSARDTVIGDTVYLFNVWGYNNSIEMTRLIQTLTLTQ